MDKFPETLLLTLIGELYVKNRVLADELEVRRQIMKPDDIIPEDAPDEPEGDQVARDVDKKREADDSASTSTVPEDA